MSTRILVVPEDPMNNGYILKPLVERMLEECGKVYARVTVLTNPRIRGFSDACEWVRGLGLASKSIYNLVLFLPDADGKSRESVFRDLETAATDAGVSLICTAAVQEVEVWLLAGHIDLLGISWERVRTDVSVKERVFDPFLARYGDPRSAGGGRDALMRKTLQQYDRLLKICPELKKLEERIRQCLAGQ